MLFNSIQFIVFFLIVTTFYFLFRPRYRWLVLSLASCYFYMSFVPVYIIVILAIIGLDYVSGILIEKSTGGRRKLYLVISLVLNVLILVFFKYYNFLNENIAFLLKWFGIRNQMPFLNIIIPLGLSFQTFQALSYLLEVYRGKQKAEKNFGFFHALPDDVPQTYSRPY